MSHDALVGVTVQVKAGMGSKEVAYRFGRVRAAVVDDQVQRHARDGVARSILRKELPELRCAMAPGHRSPNNPHLVVDVENSSPTDN